MSGSLLTDIARDHCPEIEYAAPCEKLKDGVLGCVRRGPDETSFRILIRKDLLRCVILVLFVLYHEVAHIVLGQCNHWQADADKTRNEALATEWAFNQMGTFNADGSVNEECAACYQCIISSSEQCLKPSFVDLETGVKNAEPNHAHR